MVIGTPPSGHLLDRPRERRPQGLLLHRPTGLADGRQPLERPFLRTALLQLAHEPTLRQHDQVHVPGLALEATQLTLPQPELLLPVPMKRLRARPTMPIHPNAPAPPPGGPVGDQDLDRFGVVAIPPQ